MKKIKIYRLAKTKSTNEVAKKLCKDKTDFVIVAEEQTAGKGRMGREWISPKGGLYFSICTDKKSILPLRASVAVVKALEDIDVEPNLKWPNDILVNDKKLGGILVEVVGEKAVVGIGINVNKSPLEYSISLKELINERISKYNLMKRIIINFHIFKDVLSYYRSHSSTIGKQVKIETPTCDLFGLVEDIDEKGCIVFKDGRKVISGDVIHLRDATE